MTIQEKKYSQLLSFVKAQKLTFEEKDEGGGKIKRVNINHGKSKCIVKVYHTGTILVQGSNTSLKQAIEKAKEAIENEKIIKDVLPVDIEKFPDLLKEKVPDIDDVAFKFIEETLFAIKSNAILSAFFMLGAASEKVILNLIDAYGNAIENDAKREKFLKERIGKFFISRKFEEFKKSYKCSSPKPPMFQTDQDFEIKIEAIFQFCRICRNEVGHPQIVPDIDKGILLANLGQFIKYIETVYSLINFYNENKITL